MLHFLKYMEKVLEERLPAALCTIVQTTGSTPLKAGSRMIVGKSGLIYGTIGGGVLEHAVMDEAAQVMTSAQSSLKTHQLVKDYHMCCGGTVTVFTEKIGLPKQLLIFGAGHIGRALCEYAKPLDFQITVIDDREGIFAGLEPAKNLRLIRRDFPAAMDSLTFDVETFIVILTYNHQLDRKILAECLQRKYAYLGLIGSRRKAAVIRKEFLSQGIASKSVLDVVDMPIGDDISAQSPQEIAISILSRLIRLKNGRIRSASIKEKIPENDLDPCNHPSIQFEKSQKS